MSIFQKNQNEKNMYKEKANTFCCIISRRNPPCKGKFSESITCRLAGFVMTHDLSANRLKAQQRLVERLDIIEAGGYEEFERVLEE